ncbi:hypothetical protein [Polaromonas sp. A23]|uniref:hypothetical protein n=1 Tax=Polaromonas sp. A23 TaxID=1944133 RepID=UPI000986F490|nr:hypothetical protein [Polaromonas sp. A23]OOG37316.1 hypothetical protein B0B52_18125 [Polaromonas sp. A23]
MRSEVTVAFQNSPPVRVDLNEVQPMPHDAARAWLDGQFTQMGCEPLRPTGKLLMADKVLVVAQAAGPQQFADAAWAQAFARAASASLAKPVIHIDIGAMSLSY